MARQETKNVSLQSPHNKYGTASDEFLQSSSMAPTAISTTSKAKGIEDTSKQEQPTASVVKSKTVSSQSRPQPQLSPQHHEKSHPIVQALSIEDSIIDGDAGRTTIQTDKTPRRSFIPRRIPSSEKANQMRGSSKSMTKRNDLTVHSSVSKGSPRRPSEICKSLEEAIYHPPVHLTPVQAAPFSQFRKQVPSSSDPCSDTSNEIDSIPWPVSDETSDDVKLIDDTATATMENFYGYNKTPLCAEARRRVRANDAAARPSTQALSQLQLIRRLPSDQPITQELSLVSEELPSSSPMFDRTDDADPEVVPVSPLAPGTISDNAVIATPEGKRFSSIQMQATSPRDKAHTILLECRTPRDVLIQSDYSLERKQVVNEYSSFLSDVVTLFLGSLAHSNEFKTTTSRCYADNPCQFND